ncbi:MAG TPA: 16S rRNA (adenine(1518)-N(6)/adenine(1519)-N(6))-dimethyltransferase, partial [Desulfovibrio sp.]|nr:16S rRNA (adenine(1518)-N(6)/adenine(1519)-N(6))-dimethyltransferase [Desulfovibrio sp.]
MNTEKIPAKKSLGQHFLKNESVINKIIELGDFSAADQI